MARWHGVTWVLAKSPLGPSEALRGMITLAVTKFDRSADEASLATRKPGEGPLIVVLRGSEDSAEGRQLLRDQLEVGLFRTAADPSSATKEIF
jgi:hypothetical protein